MRFIPEYSSLAYSRQYGKSPLSLSGRWPLEDGSLQLEFEEERKNESPRYRFILKGKQGIFLHSVSLTGRLEGTLRPVSLFSEGHHSRTCVEILSPSDRQYQTRRKAGEHDSASMVILSDGLNPDLMLAQEAPFQEFTSCTVHSARQPVHITLTWVIEREVEAGQSYSTGWITQSAGTGEVLLRDWSLRNASRLPSINKPGKTPPMVWSPAPRRYFETSAEEIRRNLNAAREKRLPFDVLLIDDGWQRTIGDWTGADERFNDKLPVLAQEIAAADFRPGLWIAPFVAARDSSIYAKPGWLLCNERGKPVEAGYNPRWKKQMFALDISHPEVAEYITQLITRITRDWGFSYLKLDFLHAASLNGSRYNSKRTPAQVLIEGLERIRKAAGDMVHLAANGLPLPAGEGILDSVSIAPEFIPQSKKSRLPGLPRTRMNEESRRVIRNIVLRSHMNRTFWINVAGHLIFTKSASMVENQRNAALRAALIYSGGSLFVADDLSLYGEEEAELIKNSFAEARELSKGQTTPLRLFGEPGVCTVYNDSGCIVLFNLNDTETTIELRLSPFRELLAPYNSYRPFDGAEDHPLEAPRNITLKPREYRQIQLRNI
ncbi:glycoside hydrolase family 36 protein [Marispirochaeta sp.]|uniref:glycoside hydrolase family 36 protein n=1 Tax=Marispirochaeta sp. TaxID=2038653 RepID=UPI0029C609CE|nr:glycoside hydrolase family 36 protein [Marispirochaeta sp.]